MGNSDYVAKTERPKSIVAESFHQMVLDIQDNLVIIERYLDQVFGARIKESKEMNKTCGDLPFDVLKNQIQNISEKVCNIKERIESSL